MCTAASSLSVSPNLTRTHEPFHCWCYLEMGSSVDCCVHQSIMNINEEPPHQPTCIIHQPVDLFVRTPVGISFLSLSLYTLSSPAVEVFVLGITELIKKEGKCLSAVITSTPVVDQMSRGGKKVKSDTGAGQCGPTLSPFSCDTMSSRPPSVALPFL